MIFLCTFAENLKKMTSSIRYQEITMRDLNDSKWRIPGSFYLAVTSGSAVFDVGADSYEMLPQTEFNMPVGCIVSCSESTADFSARVIIYPPTLLEIPMRVIDSKWFEWNAMHPHYRHTPDERSQRTWRELMQWMDMAETLFSSNSVILFPQMQQENFILGFWMWNIGTIQDKVENTLPQSRSHSLYRQFLKLVNEHCIHEHNVEYYAQKLHITRRYLNRIVNEQTRGRTPKDVIDRRLVMEIKDLLATTDLTVSQIGDRLGFQDQSSLSRYFKHHTLLYPSDYRKSLVPRG